MNYYNENDPKAAQWIRELIKGKHIADGFVDTRDIPEVIAEDLRDYRQCHFFAGIGGWSYALHLAGWPDDREVWTGSCPCQPFSVAGRRKTYKDPRHLWPEFHRLIKAGKPAIVFGEQVASKAGRLWLARVRTDLETLAYEIGAADLCAAGLGAPHIRQRLFWVANANGGHASAERLQRGGQYGFGTQDNCSDFELADGASERRDGSPEMQRADGRRFIEASGGVGRLADTERDGRWTNEPRRETEERIIDGRIGGLVNSNGSGCGEQSGPIAMESKQLAAKCSGGIGERLGDAASGGRGERGNAPLTESGGHIIGSDWSRFDFIHCRDGKTRRIESGTFPLAHGIPGRVGLLRGYGNAIVPQLAAEFIGAFMELSPLTSPLSTSANSVPVELACAHAEAALR